MITYNIDLLNILLKKVKKHYNPVYINKTYKLLRLLFRFFVDSPDGNYHVMARIMVGSTMYPTTQSYLAYLKEH